MQLSTFWVASTRSVFFFTLSLTLALWQFLATCLEVRRMPMISWASCTDCSIASLQLSFYTGGLGASPGDTIVWPYWALDSITVASLFGFLCVIIVQVSCLLERPSDATRIHSLSIVSIMESTIAALGFERGSLL